MEEVSVIIPVLNEAEAVGKVIDEVIDTGISLKNIIVVDGGSTDGTIDIVRSKGVKLVFQEGRGKAMAVKTGLEHVRTRYVVVMDGDYTYPASYIRDLYDRIRKGYDLVIGARKYSRGAQNPIYRFGNRVLTKIFNILFGSNLSDVLSGMYIVKTNRLREINFEMPHFSIESEIVAHIVSTGGRVCEIPISYRKRLGRKKLGVRHGIAIARDIVRLSWRYNPAFFISALGSLLLVPGLILGSWVAYHYFFTGIKYYVKGLIAVFLTITGILSIFHAITALYLKRIELRMHMRMTRIRRYLEELLGEKDINKRS